MIKVSIIMPAYNSEKFIRDALSSIPKRDDVEIISTELDEVGKYHQYHKNSDTAESILPPDDISNIHIVVVLPKLASKANLIQT